MSFPTNKYFVESRKLRGGYYTPYDLAYYLTKWGIRSDTDHILEPCCGDGNFILSIVSLLNNSSQIYRKKLIKIIAIELDKKELNKAKNRVEKLVKNHYQITWIQEDFFEAYDTLKQNNKFDLIIGNPPFIRFQYFDEQSRYQAFNHLREAGYKPTKLANAWTAFVQLSLELLQEGGRLAMVIPAELLQVKYANELRDRLTTKFEHLIIIGFKKLVFPKIQQEIVLLLAEGKRDNAIKKSDIHTIELEDGRELLSTNNLENAIAHIPSKHSRIGMKWTALFLNKSEFYALDEAQKAKELTPLGKLAEVDIGIVTGRNSFFILHEKKKEEIDVSNFTIPIIGRTSVLKSTVFRKMDYDNYKCYYPSYLLNLNGIPETSFPNQLKQYLKYGEQENINLAYKCKIRKRWFDVPSIYIPDAFLFRQIHRFPLLVSNQANVTSTDTIHRVRVKKSVNINLLASIFFNSLSLAWAEVCGRSYGGGVLELEPSEAEELPMPYNDEIKIDDDKVETLLRKGLTFEALDYVDKATLKDYIGFDNFMISRIRKSWEQLRDRRIKRR